MSDDRVKIIEIKANDTWQIRHEIMWPEMPFDFIKLPNDHLGKHFGLFKKDELITIASLFIDNDSAQFRKLATLKEKQGNGHGTQMILFLIEYATKINCTKIWCNARENKAFFYEKFGLKKTDQKYSKGNIDFVVMEKTIKKR